MKRQTQSRTQLDADRRNRQAARYASMTARELVAELGRVTETMTANGCPDSLGTQMREAATLIRAAIAMRDAVAVEIAA